LQSNINGSHDQQTTVSSQQTVCNDSGTTTTTTTTLPADDITATTPEGLSAGEVTVTYGRGGATTSEEGDLNGAADDPIINYAAGQIAPHPVNCPASAGPAPYTAVSEPLPQDETYVGLGSVTVTYTLTGPTAQLDARVWDVPPGLATYQAGSPDCQQVPVPRGCPLLITRGTYRLDVQGGYDAPSGQIRIPLMGNQYAFHAGDRIRLDLTQFDGPSLRRSNVPSAISFGDPTLTLPTRQSATTTLTGF
jgi:hypothetical protein